MRRLVVAFFFFLVCVLGVSANERRQGYCMQQTTGIRSLGCTVTIYNQGTLTLATTVYSDNLNTPLANPFTANSSTGLWAFYADNGHYDIQFSGGSPTISPAYTLADYLFQDILAPGVSLNLLFVSSQSNNVAQSGFLRLAQGDCINWRNFANSNDNCLTENASDLLTFKGNTFAYANASNAFTAANTHSSTESFTGTTTATNFNGHLTAGPGATPTIDTQKTTAIAAGGGVVDIAPGYTGAESSDCSTHGSDGNNVWSGNPSVLIIDWRSASSVCIYPVSINSSTTLGLTPFAATKFVSSPSTTASGGISTAKYTGNLTANGGNLNGSTSEVDIIGTVTAAPTATVVGSIGQATVRSTGFAIPDLAVYSALAGIDRSGTTTNVTRAYAYLANACVNSSGGSAAISECYGLYTLHNTAGTSRNYAALMSGRVRFGYFAGDNGGDLENSSGSPINIFQNDGTDTVAYRPLTDIKGTAFKTTANVPLLEIGRNVIGIGIGGGISAQAPASGNTGFQHKRVSGCATAASLNATCDVTVTWTAPFVDANYTATCSGDVVTSGVPIVEGHSISAAKTGAAITVRTLAITAAAAQFTSIDCSGVHD